MGHRIVDEGVAGLAARRARAASRRREGARGQVLVIFAASALVLVGMCAVVVDVAWYWSNTLSVQRAADAAALAGAVLLPKDVPNAVARAQAEATKNGYTAGGGVIVKPCSDANKPSGCTGGGGNDRQLNVTITAPVSTFFMRVFGINSINATRSSKAEYVLPVPMGSPENYYGLGLLVKKPTPNSSDTGYRTGTPTGSGSQWTTPANADAQQNTSYALSALANATAAQRRQEWSSFIPATGAGSFPTWTSPETLSIDSITVRTRAFINGGTGNSSTCQLQAELSWNNGGSWTTAVPLTTPLPTAAPANGTYQTFAPTSAPTATWGRAWSDTELETTNFRVRLTIVRGTNTDCDASRKLAVDTLEVVVAYTFTGAPAPVAVRDPYNAAVLAPQKFWGAMQSQGAPSIQGDAYMTGFATRKTSSNANYFPEKYYNYGIDIYGSGGQVWIFDPGFCDTQPVKIGTEWTNRGTGENWTVGESNGAATAHPVSAQYNLRNTNDTPYDMSDDPLVATSGTTFRQMNYTDPNVGGRTGTNLGSPTTNPTDCGSVAWHNNWWPLPGAQNLAPGQYRLQTTSRIYSAAIGTLPAAAVLDATDDQTDASGLNSFAVWTTSGGGTPPRIYGLGTMEAYFALPGNQTPVFYLAQIDERYAGKWMDIDLWDPGDTGSLGAVLRFLAPDGGTGTVTNFYWNHSTGSVKPANFDCGPSTSGLVSSLTTSTGSGGIFNGQWVRVCIKLDDLYSAPIDPGSGEPGWWRISYEMTGTASSNPSTDLTTWEVNIRGNPVHLKVP